MFSDEEPFHIPIMVVLSRCAQLPRNTPRSLDNPLGMEINALLKLPQQNMSFSSFIQISPLKNMHTDPIKLLLGCFLAVMTSTTVLADLSSNNTSSGLTNAAILLIRHAEKPQRGSSLSPAGKARAKAYVSYFTNLTIDGRSLTPDCAFASKDSDESHRARLTIQPTTKKLGLKIDSQFRDDQVRELARELQSRAHGTNILICWHHGEIPQLLRALNADPQAVLPNSKWPDDVFDWLILLRYDQNGNLSDARRINENLSPAAGSN